MAFILNMDTLTSVRDFLQDDYVSMAPVCQDWKLAWAKANTYTCPIGDGTTIDMLKYAFNNGLETTESRTKDCALLGRLDLLKVCIQFGCPYGVNVSNSASKHSHIVKWLTENGCPMDYTICTGAASYGNVELLIMAVDQGYNVDSYTFLAAAKNGQKKMMEWLYSVECPWIEYMCECTAERGQLEALKWLVQNGCPFHYASVYRASLKNGHSDIVEWLEMLWNGFI